MYKDIKIERYELLENVSEKIDTQNNFDLIDNYKGALQEFIFTDIELIDPKKSIKKAFQSRLCIFVSSFLLRSLMLKEGIVVALNNNNFPTYYATLKSFLEVPAALGYMVNLINKNDDYEKIISCINRFIMGNRSAGSLFVGSTNAIHINDMFRELNDVIENIDCSGKTQEECEKIKNSENILETNYADVCNFGHPNFFAHLSIGGLDKNGVWAAKQNADGYKNELLSFYMPQFIIGIEIMLMLSDSIYHNNKVNGFSLLSKKHYFE